MYNTYLGPKRSLFSYLAAFGCTVEHLGPVGASKAIVARDIQAVGRMLGTLPNKGDPVERLGVRRMH